MSAICFGRDAVLFQCRWPICAQATASIFANITNQVDAHYWLLLPTEYFALVASSSPSLSQLIIGFGFPWAEQLSRVLPPSFASTYCGGVAVNDGGAAKRTKNRASRTFSNAVQEVTSSDQKKKGKSGILNEREQTEKQRQVQSANLSQESA